MLTFFVWLFFLVTIPFWSVMLMFVEAFAILVWIVLAAFIALSIEWIAQKIGRFF